MNHTCLECMGRGITSTSWECSKCHGTGTVQPTPDTTDSGVRENRTVDTTEQVESANIDELDKAIEAILNQMSFEETTYQSKTWLPNQKKQAAREWQQMRDKTLTAIQSLITAHTTEAYKKGYVDGQIKELTNGDNQ